jgi:predicted AlkP superfamily pyrophosphatase or phosphodiesterase
MVQGGSLPLISSIGDESMSQDMEQTLLRRQLPELLPPAEGWVLPHYDGLSIANLPATVATLLGSDLPGALPPLPRNLWAEWAPGLRRVVLVILDALGYRMLQKMWSAGHGQEFLDIAETGLLIPLTSVFPSTTDAALVSLRTGRPPAEHGWLAYTMYLRELGIASNAILLCPVWTRETDLLVDWGLDLETLISVPSLAEWLARAGVVSKAVFYTGFSNSGFSTMLYRGVTETRLHHHASDFWVQLRHVLMETREQNAFISAYWSGLDTLAHAYGPDTDLWHAEFRTVSHLLATEFLADLPADVRQGTLLLLTADHGQIRIPPENILAADEDPELSRHLMVPIMGESRAAFIHPRPGRADTIRDYLESAFPGWFVVLDSIEALEAGLMGKPVADETYARAGELLVLSRGTHALQKSQPPVSLVGRHGGLTQEEMLVPLIGLRLEALG